MKHILFFVFSFLGLSAVCQTYTKPESVNFNHISGKFVVTNAGNGTSGGSIVEVDPTTHAITNFVSTGVNSPKGTCVIADSLYVTDVNKVKVVNLKTGVVVRSYTVPNASFLNDITTNGTKLFVTDNAVNYIFEIDIATNHVNMHQDAAIQSPNGILYDAKNNRLIFVSFITNSPIQAVALPGFTISTIKNTNLSNLDGLTVDNDTNYYVSSWTTNKTYIFDKNFSDTAVEVSAGHSGPADIFFHKATSTFCVPNMNSNTVQFMDFSNSIRENLSDYVKIYPNPAKSIITVEFTKNLPSNVEVYNLAGKLIKEEKISGNSNRIYLVNLERGVYFLSLTYDEQKVVKKFIVN